jgi:hypothetical protein
LRGGLLLPEATIRLTDLPATAVSASPDDEVVGEVRAVQQLRTSDIELRLGGALLRYRLNKRISLQAQTGDTHSIEVRYGVD